VRPHWTPYGIGLMACALACATPRMVPPRVAAVAATSMDACSIDAEQVSVRSENGFDVTDYPGRTVIRCPGHRPAVYTNLSIRHRTGSTATIEMAADRAERE